MPRISKVISLSMPPEIAEQLQQAVTEDGRTVSEFIREAIHLHLEEREWLKRERRQRAEARLNEPE